MSFNDCTGVAADELLCEAQVSDVAGKSADIPVVTHKNVHHGYNGHTGKIDEETREQLSFVVNSNGVCLCALSYALLLVQCSNITCWHTHM